ncbi:MAG: long-chain fatty acid transporter, partial [Acinetobacter sp.]
MKLKHLSTAMILATLPATGVFAAALDRSGQSISAFLQPNNYFEAGISVLDPTVEGKDTSGNATGDMAGDYYFPGAALKLQLTDKISFGLLYDQPFGADAGYSGNNNFVTNSVTNTAFSPMQEAGVRAQVGAGAKPLVIAGVAAQSGQTAATIQGWYDANATIPGLGNVKNLVDGKVNEAVQSRIDAANAAVRSASGGTQVEVDTQNLSFIFGLSPIENVTLYAGGVYQTVKGNVSLRGQAYSIFNGYDAQIKEADGAGWLVGAAYQIPKIALKASVTYRSEIDQDATVTETGYTALGTVNPAMAAVVASPDKKLTITTPQSVNLDLQSGIMADTVAFANIRWVNWKDFSIRPDKFGQVSELATAATGGKGFNLVDYTDDQWSVNAGVGRKVTDKWAGNVSVGWDSGAGNPITTLGPTEGYWNVGVGVQFSPT